MASRSGHPGLRRVGVVALAVLLAVGGIVALIAFFSDRDTGPVSSTPGGPGQLFRDQGHAHLRAGQRPPAAYDSSPPTSGPHAPAPVTRDGTQLTDAQVLTALEAGDVILFYGTPTAPPALRALADDVAGPFDPALAQTGQAVILARRPGQAGIVAAAWRRLLSVSSPSDPALREFANAFLGVGAGGK